MARYIDADKLMQCLPNDLPYKASVKRVLTQAPAEDVVEVVRCEKCQHWIYLADEKRCSCDLHHIRTHRGDFCSYGERK